MNKKKTILLVITLVLAITFVCVGCTGFSLWGDDSSSDGLISDGDSSGSSGSGNGSESSNLPTDASGVKDNTVNITSVDLENGVSESSLADIIEKIHPTVVEINATTSSGTSAGSGVIISVTDNYSYIWTCQHVVDGASAIKIILADGKTTYSATYCGGLADKDVAVLKIAQTEGLTAAKIRNLETSPLRVGEDAIAIGNPLGSLGGTVTKGIVSATAREINMDGTVMELLQTDASINSGNSGGGLFDSNGLLIGIVNAKATGDSVEGLGFAIPIDTVSELAIELTETHNDTTNPYGGLGYIEGKFMLGVTTKMTTYNNSYVFYVSAVDTYGSFGSVIQAGDYIYSVNGNTFGKDSSLGDYLKDTKIGDEVTMVVLRRSGFWGSTYSQVTLTATIEQYVYGYNG